MLYVIRYSSERDIAYVFYAHFHLYVGLHGEIITLTTGRLTHFLPFFIFFLFFFQLIWWVQ